MIKPIFILKQNHSAGMFNEEIIVFFDCGSYVFAYELC